MAAHGYGIAAVETPNLVFSNVIWGYFVRALPQMGGILGYSIATIGALVIIGAVVLHAFQKLGFGSLMSLSVLILLLARPVLFPQFTINSGLLTLGAVICWYLYGQQGSRRTLIFGCLLAFCGYLVRSQEFLLVLLIALPLLPLKKLGKDSAAQASAVVLLLAIGVAAYVDYKSYQGDAWRSFNELNPARAPITDFGADAHLKRRPDILDRNGYSENDIDLIRNWFFVDSEIANPVALNAMLTELGPLPLPSNALSNGWIGIKAFTNPVLLPGFFAAVLLFLLFPNRKLIITWALSIAAVFALGVLGRPGILRVYIPIVSLFLIAPLMLAQGSGLRPQSILRQPLAKAVIVVALIFNTTLVISESRAKQRVSDQIRNDLYGFPTNVVVAWGALFPFSAAYPVFTKVDTLPGYRLYSLGVFTHAPFSVSKSEQVLGGGMIERLTSQEGIPIVADKRRFDLLKIYCKEHFGGVLDELAAREYGQVVVSWRRCQSNVAQ